MSLLVSLIFSRLSAFAPLVAIVGNRIYPRLADQGAAVPLVVFSQISGTQELAFGADPLLRRDRWSFSCWGNTYDEGIAVATEVLNALERYRTVGPPIVQDVFVLDRGTDLYDDAVKRFYRVVDLEIIHEGD